ncbi:Cryptochrome-1 [Halotydeus destructor]|nr:Cryptochrome-1 [Halotydeus destructor]
MVETHSDHLDDRPVHIVHWFRSKGLRLHDQPSLYNVLQMVKERNQRLTSLGKPVPQSTWRCIYLLDPWFASSSSSANKWQFLLQSLEDIDYQLRKMGSRLFVIRGQPGHVFPTLFKEWKTTHLTFEADPEPYARVRDAKIRKLCYDLRITVNSVHSHTLFNIEDILRKCSNGTPYPLTFTSFQSIVQALDPPPLPAPEIDAKLIEGTVVTLLGDDHDFRYAVPSLADLGFKLKPNCSTKWPGGEREALLRLERHLQHKAWVASFGKPKMTPNSLMAATQTGLSPYLRFGCLSARLFYHQLSELFRKMKRGNPPPSLHGQLLWRDFFYAAATNNANFDRMIGNPICVQINWNKNGEALAKWAEGKTGFPWIDAIQTQLREEGWIHQVARHATICFLTRGALWISWEDGMKVFDEMLLDADWSVNAGTWMWMSCSSFFQSIFHLYCPVNYGRKADANGDYIRKYLPVLKNFPTQYIHEPWSAPLVEQQRARCIVGKDYPLPIVDHIEASRTNLDRMRLIFAKLSTLTTSTNGHSNRNSNSTAMTRNGKCPQRSHQQNVTVQNGNSLTNGNLIPNR